jgi:hypothetical protein
MQWVLQKQSYVDHNHWYDQGYYIALKDAKEDYDARGERRVWFRIVERSDKVVWPVPVETDPAKELGA